MSKNQFITGKYFNLLVFTPEASRIKDKPVIGLQLVYSYISNCLLLAEREVHCTAE